MALDPFGASVGLDPSTPVAGADPFAPDPNAPGPLKRGFGAGVAAAKSSLYGAGALAAHAVGAKELEQSALDKASAASAEAAQSAQGVENVDFSSPGAVLQHFQYLIGNAAPTLALMAAGGAVGRTLGRFGAARLATGTAAKVLDRATLAGAVAPDVALEAGSIYPEALKTGVDHPALRSGLGGLAAASLDYLPLLEAGKYLKAAGKGGFGAIIKGALKGAPVGAALEGGQELGQSLIERASAGQDLTGPEAVSDYINSFAGGAAPGLLFGAGIGGHRASAPVAVPSPNVAPQATPEMPLEDVSTGLAPGGTFSALPIPLAPEFNAVQDTVPPAPDNGPARTGAPAPDYNRLASPVAQDADFAARDMLQRQHDALTQQIATLHDELQQPNGKRRSKGLILQEQRALTAQLGGVTTQIGNLTQQLRNREAIQEKQKKGLLVSAREAQLLRRSGVTEAAPPVEPVEQRAPRERVKQVSAQDRAQAIEGVTVESIQKHATELAAAGGFRKGTALKAKNEIIAAAQKAAKAPTIDEAEKQVYDAAIKALSGKVNAADAETFAKAVSQDVRNAPTFYSMAALDRRQNLAKRAEISQTVTPDRRQNFAKRVDTSLQLMNEADAKQKELAAQLSAAIAEGGSPQEVKRLSEQWKLAREAFGKHQQDALNLRRELEIDRTAATSLSAIKAQDDFYKLPAAEKAAVVDFHDKVQAQFGQQLLDRLKFLIGDDPNLSVQLYEAEPGQPAGSYTRIDPLKASIALALNAKDGLSNAEHEGFHYLEDHVLDGRDRAIIGRALSPGKPMFKRLLERAQAYDRANKTRIADEIVSVPEEARAYGFEMWRRGELQAEGAIQRVFEKLRAFLEKISNYVTGLGFTSIEDVFSAIDQGQYAEKARHGGGVGTLASEAATSQTKTAAFKRWFGNSKVIDWLGNPLVVYHGTSDSISEFKLNHPNRKDTGWLGTGVYVTDSIELAQSYSLLKSGSEAPNVMPLYAKLENPYYATLEDKQRLQIASSRSKEAGRAAADLWTRQLKEKGHDGVILHYPEDYVGKANVADEMVIFDPAGVKSAVGNFGTFNASTPNILYSQAAVADLERQARNGELDSEQRLSDIAVRLQADLPDPTFKAVMGATKDAFLGGLKRWRLANIASANYISRFSAGYANVQKALLTYTQRKSTLIADGVDVRLSEWRSGATDADISAVGDALMARTVKGYLTSSPEYTALTESMTPKQLRMFDQANSMIADRLQQEFTVEQATMSKILPKPEYDEWYANRSTQVQRLVAEGYVPERRYGDYTVHIYKPVEGQKPMTVFYEHFENEAAAKVRMQQYQDILNREAPDLKVDIGYKYRAERDTSISMQQFLDTARRHGIDLTQTEKERIAKALVAADSLRRNRLFRRKNVPGYSQDTMRVLAEFAVTMANKVAYSEFSSAINDATVGRPVDAQLVNGNPQIKVDPARDLWREDGPQAGFFRNISDELVDHVLSPAEVGEASRKLRAGAMLYFLGGSFSAGVVNLTSLPLNTVPWLSQHTSYTDAFTKTMSAMGMVTKNQSVLRDIAKLKDRTIAIPEVDSISGLRDALITAGEDGTTLDTEIYQIMGLTRGGLLSKSRTLQRAIEGWMLPFRFAEQVNRLSTFISAYRIGTANKLTGRDLYQFAQGAVHNTQFRYDEVNRPSLARDPLWAILFTFKSYPLFVTEMLETMYKSNPRSVVFMLLGLSLASGVQGLPFAEGIMDLIDTISQRLFGSPFNTRRALRNVAKSASEAVLGIDLSEVFLRGVINEMTGLNISSRVGLGNMIPGTRIGTADTDYGRALEDILGPVYSMGQSALQAAGHITKGDFLAALRQDAPLAVRNLTKGIQQFDRGYGQDMQGRKLVDVTGMEAFWQSLGFSSANLTKAYELDRIDKQELAFYSEVRKDFVNSLVNSLRDGNASGAQETMDAIQKWNAHYPTMPIGFSAATLRRDISLAGMPLNARTLQMLPRQLRGSSIAAEGISGQQ